MELTLKGEERNALHEAVEKAIGDHIVNINTINEAEIAKKNEYATKHRQQLFLDAKKISDRWQRSTDEEILRYVNETFSLEEIVEARQNMLFMKVEETEEEIDNEEA